MTAKEKSDLQKKVVNSIAPGKSGRLLLAPRAGKSKIIIDYIKREKIKGPILWVTPTSKLADEDIPAEFIKWKAKKYLDQLVTVTWRGLEKAQGHRALIVLDEDQHITEKNSAPLVQEILTADVILSMTGTESKSKNKKELYDKLGLKPLYKLSINKAVDIGLLANYRVKVVMVPLDERKNIEVKYVDKATKTEKSFMTSELKQYEYLTRRLETRGKTKHALLQRRRIIGNSQSKVNAAKYIINSLEGKRLVFATDRIQAETLSPYTYHGNTCDNDLKKFISGEITKIAMVNKGGTGYTYTEIDHLFMIQADSDRNGLTTQKIARTLLEQGDYVANIWIFCLKDTQDELWVESALSNFDSNKIEYINDYKTLELWTEN